MSKNEVILGVYYQGQPAISTSILPSQPPESWNAPVRDDSSTVGAPSDCSPAPLRNAPSPYRSSGRHRGESLNIYREMIKRYLAGERYAVVAVKAWR